MTRRRSRPQPVSRDGVILLVVISMLVLFSLVGIAFVVYAEGQANTARIWREGETMQHPDMDPELLLAYFLSQLIYDTDNPHSALRGHSLARNMYGRPGNITPFNGPGRLHTDPNEANDDYYKVDYTNYPWNAGRNPDQYGSPNPPYTYPDFNHMYLAAVRGSDGTVLIPSFARFRPDGTPVSLRPDRNYHAAFPPLTSRSGDVKNRADGPGFNNGPNDSIWIDVGFPVMTAPDGRKFKPLFAVLIEDLDNRLNLNVHGNIIGWPLGGENTSTYTISHQGMVRGEVSFERLFDWPGRNPNAKNPEVWNLFKGGNGIRGRYDPNQWTGGGYSLAPQYTASSHYYAPTNQDCWPEQPTYQNFFLPHLSAVIGLSGDGRDQMDATTIDVNNQNHRWRLGWAPRVEHAYSNGWITTYDKMMNPTMYNFFDPSINNFYIGGVLKNIQDRRFEPYNMEAMLRYGDTGSPALGSELFRLCPNTFGENNPVLGARNRRLATTLSMDSVTPGMMPCYTNPGGASTFVGTGNSYATTPPIPFPPPAASPNSGEFGAGWQATSASLSRLIMNQSYSNEFPPLNAGNSSCFSFNNAAVITQYQKAYQERVNMCKEVFNRLRAATGATDPTANRWLAQLAVNIVDFTQYMPTNKHRDPWSGQLVPDDVMTCFEWSPGEYVYGTVLPRLVLSETYAELAASDPNNRNAPRKVNFWAELHNPLTTHHNRRGPVPEQMAMQHWSVPMSMEARARLWVNYPAGAGYAPYRLVIADTVGNNRRIPNPANPLGTPQGILKTIDKYQPAMTKQPLVMSGDDLNQVFPFNWPDPGYDPKPTHAEAPKELPFNNCSWGRNRGWYVIGPPTPFPGTDDDTVYKKFFATLPHPDMSVDNGQVGQKFTLALQRLACPYLPPQPDPAQVAARGYYNPYVTVDWMDQVEANDGDQPVDQRRSIGRNQPYAAHLDSMVKQTPQPALANLKHPKHSLFFRNTQKLDDPNPVFAFDYIFWCNRMLLNTLELLHVSGYKPSELTQRFVLGPPDPVTGKPLPVGRFGHRAPWYESDKLIYRSLEYFEGYLRNQWTPMGGRDPGRVNLNNVWDYPTFEGLCDWHGGHFFTRDGVQAIFRRMMASRSPNGTPRGGDRPFLGYGAPFAAPGLQFQAGAGIEDTFLRPAPDLDPIEAACPPMYQRRLFEPKYLDPNNPNPAELRRHAVKESGNDPGEIPHPYLRDELLRRILDHCTTRSNVFGVWVTVGFFEVRGVGGSGGPPQLGPEINFANNRHVRHRMFAIVDRTRLTIAHDPVNRTLIPGQVGARPYYIDSLTSVSGSGQPETVKVSVLLGKYEEISWEIKRGDQLVIDTGSGQEIVTVLSTPTVDTFTAIFAKPHVVGFSISNAVPGNPGPQPRFDMRTPDYQSVVRYFNIIE